MNWKFWKPKTVQKIGDQLVPTNVNLNRNETLTASIQVGIIPDGAVQYINVTAVDNQRAFELFKAVREELKKK